MGAPARPGARRRAALTRVQSSRPIRAGGQIRTSTRATRSPRGTAPKSRESSESARSSPSTNTSSRGTVTGPEVDAVDARQVDVGLAARLPVDHEDAVAQLDDVAAQGDHPLQQQLAVERAVEHRDVADRGPAEAVGQLVGEHVIAGLQRRQHARRRHLERLRHECPRGQEQGDDADHDREAPAERRPRGRLFTATCRGAAAPIRRGRGAGCRPSSHARSARRAGAARMTTTTSSAAQVVIPSSSGDSGLPTCGPSGGPFVRRVDVHGDDAQVPGDGDERDPRRAGATAASTASVACSTPVTRKNAP